MKVLELTGTTADGSVVTLFYDDAKDPFTGWGVNDGLADTYGPLHELLSAVELADRAVLVKWIEDRTVQRVKDLTAGPALSIEDVRVMVPEIDMRLREADTAAGTTAEHVDPGPVLGATPLDTEAEVVDTDLALDAL